MVLILGAGESGLGAALLARSLKLTPFVSDQSSIGASTKQQLIELEIDFEEHGHVIAWEMIPEFVVKSPGIPDTASILVHLKAKGVEIISEIEFAFRHCKGKILAITGSNGKTTTTNLCYHLLKVAGLDVVKVGNVGYSFARSVSEAHHEIYVIEVSSFQLDQVNQFHPYVSIILNLTPDHLDRYEYNFEKYVQSKFNIYKNHLENEHLIINGRDPELSKRIDYIKTKAKIHKLMPSLDSEENILDGMQLLGHFRNSVLKGNHNADNAVCAIRAVELLGCSSEQIQAGLNSFVNDPHRLESLGEIQGIEFINDSKATNVDSVFWALDAMKKPVVWIAGGQDKGNEYDVLKTLVQTKVKALVCLGVDNTKLMQSFIDVENIRDTHHMKDAVLESMKLAKAGDVILLSPACASFDLFKNYIDRGDQFRNEFELLKLNQ